MDKKTWGDGPWQTEPDKLEFNHNGYDCILIRNRGGAWCGYTQIPKDHPWFKDLGILDERIDVHGGVTYQGNRMDDDRYFVGFDCAHWLDLSPAYRALLREMEVGKFGAHLKAIEDKYRERLPKIMEEDIYKDIEFAKNECIKMADQIHAGRLEKPKENDGNKDTN